MTRSDRPPRGLIVTQRICCCACLTGVGTNKYCDAQRIRTSLIYSYQVVVLAADDLQLQFDAEGQRRRLRKRLQLVFGIAIHGVLRST